MKRTSLFLRLKPSSFTLVELLVVMAIIAILAGVLFSAGNSAILAAKRASAANMANQINTAVTTYYTEYSVYPVPANTTTDVFYSSNNATGWENLIYALCYANPASPGASYTSTVSNTRGIAFLNLKKGDCDANGVPVNPLYTSLANNNYYNISIDSDYNGIITNDTSLPASLPQVITGGCAVWANCNISTSTNSSFYVKTF